MGEPQAEATRTGRGTQPIPKVIHRVWLGDDAEPEWTSSFAATWERPGWTLRQWDGPGDLAPLVNQDIYDQASEIAPNHVGQLRADILRYELLYRHGGVYVDHDFELLSSIDGLLDGVGCFAAWETPGVWVNNAIVGAMPQHPFIGALVEGLADNVRRHAGSRPNKLTGPQYLTRVWRRHGHADAVTVFPKQWFYPYLWNELDRGGETFEGAYAVHHWANKRRGGGVPWTTC